MKSTSSSVEFLMLFADAGDALKFSSWFYKIAGAAFSYFRTEHPDLWNERKEDGGLQIGFQQAQEGRSSVVRVSLKLSSITKDVAVKCNMDLSAMSPKCTLTIVDHSTAPEKATTKYNASIENGVLVKHGLK